LLKLQALQILDISRNKLDSLPEDINRMKALRVLSVSNNQLVDLPFTLGNMDSLKLLKMAGNPLNDSLKNLLKAEEESAAASAMPVAEHESDTHLTLQVKKYLRTEAAAQDSGGESRYVISEICPNAG
jgi:Leucine-rich repeat (LRR) protein